MSSWGIKADSGNKQILVIRQILVISITDYDLI